MKRILLVCLTAVLALASSELWAQDRTVAGKVTATEDGSGLPGVNVVVKGTAIGTVTDSEGAYSLGVPASADILVFTFIGLKSEEVQIGDRTTVDISLALDVTQLSEVVVTALNIPREKASLGYGTQQVSGDQVNMAKEQNFVNSLSGKVAGVQIRTNNNFGGSTNIVIRGNKSVTGNNQPLFVVDGIPMDNSTGNDAYQRAGRLGYDYGSASSDINPEDIATINVLKGAAASALYGSRASNGVVMITTKKGKARKGLGISLSTGVTVGKINKDTFIQYQDQYGAGYAREWFGYYGPDGFYQDDVNGDGTLDNIVPTNEDGSYGAPFDPNLNVYHWDSFVPESDNFGKQYPWVAAKNTPVDYFETQVTLNNSIAISGGNDANTFRLSYTNFDNTGVMPNQTQKRNTVNFSGSSQINKQLTANVNFNFVNTATVGRASTGYGGNQMANFRQWWQTNVDVKSQKDIFFKTGRNITWNGGDFYDPETPIFWDNLYWTRYKNYQNDERSRVYGNFALNYKPTDWLNVMGRVSGDTYSEIREERIAVGSVPSEFGINKADEGSGYGRRNRTVSEFNYDLILTFNKKFGSDFGITGVLGSNIRTESFSNIWATTQGGLIVPELYSLSNSVSTVPNPEEVETKKEVYGFFANANLGYKNMLYLDLSARNDISSALPPGNNSYFYHSEALSFVFSELVKVPFMDFGKVRLNYAEVGNDTGPNRTTTAYTKNPNFGPAVLFSYPTTVNNPNLQPEELVSYEAGLELAGFERRLTFDLGFYKQNSSNQIVSVELSKATGASFLFLNGGEIENKGIEVTLGYDIIKNNAFKWNITANWAKNTSLVKSLPSGIDNYQINSFQGGVSLNATVGQPYGVLRGTGYQFLNGQRVINSSGYPVAIADQVIGNPNPDWTGGVMNTLKYKGVQLSFLIDVSQGGEVYSLDMHYGQGTGMMPETAGLNDLGNPKRDLLADGGGVLFDGVQADGSVNTVRARADYYGGAFYWGNSSRQPAAMTVYDGSYVKFRELALTYNLPSKMLGNVFQGVALSLVGRNLWILSKNVPYADPESGLGAGNGQGYLSGSYPTVRTVGFKLDLNF
ncbi:MAG: SusC/RagA family TonB-linked outer membrane protein [Cyclobacteriaceae bacterium]|nr:SusC/RagA family TonB-linked outer membrane protein [Cyclobacteriaceae bacterium]MDH4295555.1 SusC/RagA family TonB-linked outer membrane protein [Cyclobacteriaceae bacterium]MDH5249130.1 SusC/RagA family TonB-linked outer membrane protein [Cyclobacteriaceae bacterium]